MPTVFKKEGYRFFFYSNEGDEPVHIHVEKGDGEGKVWLEPELEIEYLLGFKEKEKKRIFQLISDNSDKIKEAWNEHFS